MRVERRVRKGTKSSSLGSSTIASESSSETGTAKQQRKMHRNPSLGTETETSAMRHTLGLSGVTFLESLHMLCTCLGGMIKGPLKDILLQLEMSQEVFKQTGPKYNSSLGTHDLPGLCRSRKRERLQKKSLQEPVDLTGNKLDHQPPAQAGSDGATHKY